MEAFYSQTSFNYGDAIGFIFLHNVLVYVNIWANRRRTMYKFVWNCKTHSQSKTELRLLRYKLPNALKKQMLWRMLLIEKHRIFSGRRYTATSVYKPQTNRTPKIFSSRKYSSSRSKIGDLITGLFIAIYLPQCNQKYYLLFTGFLLQ